MKVLSVSKLLQWLFLTSVLAAMSMAATPNIIFILADDMGYGDLSCLNPESKVPTPNLDRLAREGAKFTNVHSAGSTCVPSRYGLMTGRMPWRKGIDMGMRTTGPLIEDDRITLPKVLSQAGYDTAAFGKWHLGFEWPWLDSVSKRNNRNLKAENMDFSRHIGGGPPGIGFDYSFGVDGATFPNAFIENGHTIGIPDTEVVVRENGGKAIGVEGWDIYDLMPGLTRKVVEYIEGKNAGSDPFFIYFAMTAPHTPLVPAEAFQGKTTAGPYGDFVHQCDYSVGQVLAALERTGLEEDTLVIFTSDNGSPAKNKGAKKGTIIAETGHSPNGIQSGFKGDALEGGHHVPFIARWPGEIQKGAVNDGLLCLVDMLATVAELTGQPHPEQGAEDSISALSLLKGVESGADGRVYLVHRSQRLYHTRQGDWKLIFGSGSGGLEKHAGESDLNAWQLYNLKHDPAEKENLYRKFPEIEETLEKLLKKETGKRDASDNK